MNPSPFHGIFSALSESDEKIDAATPIPFEDADSAEATIMPVRSAGEGVLRKGQIAVDIFEQDNYYIIRAPIAGVRLSDLDIEVDGKVVTIRGVRNLTEKIPEHQYYLQECFWGEFSRSITLPCSIDPKKVKATFSKDSILKVLIPKEEKVKIIRVNEA